MKPQETDWVKCAHKPNNLGERSDLAYVACWNCMHGKPHYSDWLCAVECGVCESENTCKPTTEDWEA